MHPRMGLKRTTPEGTQEEADELRKLYDDLRRQISVPRIDRLAARSLGVWDEEEQAVCVLRKDGKFGNFGYSRKGKLYLEYFEAMFLLELGRLQLEYHSMTISIEQAYLLLLGEAASPKYNEYLVYSNLTRVGYILVRHQNRSYSEHIKVTQTDCTWEVALSALHNKPVPDYIEKSPYYAQAVSQMQQVKDSIMQQDLLLKCDQYQHTSEGDSTIDFGRKMTSAAGKRKASVVLDDTKETKKPCLNAPALHQKSFVDFLKDEPELKHFRNIFEKIDIIQLKLSLLVDCCAASCRSLGIQFDLHLHNDGFKKSTPKPPTFRLIILSANEAFPTHTEISMCHRQQKYPVPLLVVSVSESKQIQAFLYYFTYIWGKNL